MSKKKIKNNNFCSAVDVITGWLDNWTNHHTNFIAQHVKCWFDHSEMLFISRGGSHISSPIAATSTFYYRNVAPVSQEHMIFCS